MRSSRIFLVSVLLCGAGGIAMISWTQGQDRSPPIPVGPDAKAPLTATPSSPPGRDLSKMGFFPKMIYRSGQAGSEWLQRANGADGRFVPGYIPALRTPLESDSALRQTGAALALARAARYYGNKQAEALASQALLTLLLDTAPEDAKNPQVRVSTLPPGAVNRLAAAAVLVQAVGEMPAPAPDLLDQADQLCNYLRKQQRSDGSFACNEGGADDNDAVNFYSGEALYALTHSYQHRPAAWKLEAVRKALPYYQARWRAGKNLMLIPRHTAAYTEAYLLTKDKAYADFVFEMNDWLCTFQFTQLDPLHPQWVGGFMSCADGKPLPTAPQVVSATYAESLAEAARVARQIGDVPRWQRYKDTLERCLQFLTTLQYTDGNSQHFAEWYRPVVLGAFHASHTDGNLRLDYTQQAVCAMVAYLTHVAEVP
jgi:hypothetical protein